MRVGIMIEGQEGLTWERWRRLVQAAEDMSYESLCRSDHLTGLWGEAKRPSLETWTSLTVLAMRTRRIRFGPMVSPITFYHPALLAKMATALDTLSGGRLDLGIGGGWNEHEHAMFGFPLPPMKERLDRLEAAARYIRALGAGEPVTLAQPYYPLQQAENYPLPAHGRLRLVVGGRGEKRTLRIAAEFADEWNATRIDLADLPRQARGAGRALRRRRPRPRDHRPLADDPAGHRARPGRRGSADRRGAGVLSAMPRGRSGVAGRPVPRGLGGRRSPARSPAGKRRGCSGSSSRCSTRRTSPRSSCSRAPCCPALI